jgi:hypothetical protein
MPNETFTAFITGAPQITAPGASDKIPNVTGGITNYSTVSNLFGAIPCDLKFGTDGTYNIGAVSANRPAIGYFSTGLWVAGNTPYIFVLGSSTAYVQVTNAEGNEGIRIQHSSGEAFSQLIPYLGGVAGTAITLVGGAGGKVGVNQTAPLSSLGIGGNLSVGATYSAVAAPTSGAIFEGNVLIGTATPSVSPNVSLYVVGTASDEAWFKINTTRFGMQADNGTHNNTIVGIGSCDSAKPDLVGTPAVGSNNVWGLWSFPGFQVDAACSGSVKHYAGAFMCIGGSDTGAARILLKQTAIYALASTKDANTTVYASYGIELDRQTVGTVNYSLLSHGDMLIDDNSGFFAIGNSAAQTGAIRLRNALAIKQRNAANSADLNIAAIDASDILQIAGSGVSSTNITGAVTATSTLAVTGALTVTSTITGSLNTAALPTLVAGTMLQLGQADGIATLAALESFAAQSNFVGRRANGTAASPSALAADNIITAFSGYGYGTAYTTARAAIRFYAGEAWDGTNQGTYMTFYTTPLASTSMAEVMRISPAGNLILGATAVNSSAVKVLGIATGTAPAAGVTDMVQIYSSDDSAGNTVPSFYCEGTGVLATGQADSASSTRVKMRINGTVVTLLGI